MSVQFGLFLTNQHPVGTDQVQALQSIRLINEHVMPALRA